MTEISPHLTHAMQSLQNNKGARILLIYTGGTIGMGRNPVTGTLEPLDLQHLISNMPEIAFLHAEVESYQFTPPIDSSDMSPRLWAQLVRIITKSYDRYDGFVVLHGTDTMAYSASALSFMLENLTKPVILTGSQLPVGMPRTDGKENLLTSIEIAMMKNDDGHPVVPEVCIYFSGRLLRGNRATKQSAEGFRAFESFNYPHLCDAGVNFTFHRHHILHPNYDKPMVPHLTMNPSVVVFSLYPGVQESLLRHMICSNEIRGIIIRSYGSGNAPQYPWLIRLLREASGRGVIVVNISQCLKGSVEMGRYDTGYQLKKAGVVSGRDSTVESAITKLMFLLAHYNEPHTIRQLMCQSLAGEIS